MSPEKITYFSFSPFAPFISALSLQEDHSHSNTVRDMCVGLKAATKLLSLTKTSCAAFQNKMERKKKQCSKQNHAGEEGREGEERWRRGWRAGKQEQGGEGGQIREHFTL